MTLPSSGPITMAMVNQELGLPATATISLNDPRVRALAGKPSGAISMSDLRGKSNIKLTPVTIYNLHVGFVGGPQDFCAVSLALTATGLVLIGKGQGYTGDGITYVARTDEWLPSGVGVGDYHAVLTKASGSDPTGDSLGVALPLSTTRTWTLQVAANGAGIFETTFYGSLYIYHTASSTLVANVSVDMTARLEMEF